MGSMVRVLVLLTLILPCLSLVAAGRPDWAKPGAVFTYGWGLHEWYEEDLGVLMQRINETVGGVFAGMFYPKQYFVLRLVSANETHGVFRVEVDGQWAEGYVAWSDGVLRIGGKEFLPIYRPLEKLSGLPQTTVFGLPVYEVVERAVEYGANVTRRFYYHRDTGVFVLMIYVRVGKLVKEWSGDVSYIVLVESDVVRGKPQWAAPRAPPKLTLLDPEVRGLTVTVSGVATPGYEGAKIDRLTWDWGDGSSEDRWFPASHTYSKPGTYTIKVTAYQSDGLSVTKTIQVNVRGAPSLHITLITNATTLLKGKSILILIKVKDHQNNPIDAVTSCRISTPSGKEVSVDLLRIATGAYQARFTGTTEAGDYRITATAQKPGYAGDAKEIVFHVEGAYGITNIYRVYYDPLKRDIIEVDGKVVKEGNNFIIDLLLTNKREGYYKLVIYRYPVYFVTKQTLVYQGMIGPRQILYPIRIQTPISDRGDSQICIDVTLSWEMEVVKAILDLFLPVSDPLPYLEEFVKFQSELTSYMKQRGYLPPEYDNMQESFRKAIVFLDGFAKLCTDEPNYVLIKIAEFAKNCGLHYTKEGIMDKIKAFSSKLAFIVKLILWNWHVWTTPAAEVIYVNVGEVRLGSLAPRASSAVNFLFAASSVQRIDGATEFSLQNRLITTAPADASSPQFEGNTIGNIDINLLKDELTFILNASFPVPEPATFEGIDTFSVTSHGIRRGDFIVANASVEFGFHSNEIASYFFRVINESLPTRRSILEWTGLVEVLSSELGINGTNVYLKASGLRPAPPGLAQENWKFTIKENHVSLNVFRKMVIRNCQIGSCNVHLAISPELFNVTSLYCDRIVTRLFMAPKMEALAIDPKPAYCKGDPEVGYECSWSRVPKELTLNYIIDEAPPIILKIDQDPKTVTFENDVVITVNASDAGVGLKNVTVSYSTDGGATWKKLRADQVAGDIHQGLFKAIIPKQPYGTSVTYKLEAYDRAGNVWRSEAVTYRVELATWVYGSAIIALMLALAIGYAIYRRIRHR
jgi:PKD repeat protein